MAGKDSIAVRARRAAPLLVATLVLGVVALGVVITLPPRATVLDAAPISRPPVVTGAFHVHSNRSDGTGTVDEIAAAAARAGLTFVILADHGDGTESPLVPAYRSGVLTIASVEISTTGGHYIALGLPRAPYPLGGEPRDVVEDVARLGSVGIAAHPRSPKTELAWRDWDLPFDGLEWLNADSEWRDDGYLALTRLAFQYPLRPAEALASLLDRPAAVLEKWDERTRTRQTPALAGADAHARLGARGELYGSDATALLKVPSYEASFRAFAIRLVLDAPLSGDAVADAARVVDAVRRGHVYTAIDAVARPAAFEFTASSGETQVRQGDVLAATGPVTLRARVNAPPASRIVLLREGKTLREAEAASLEHLADGARAAYRVEVHVPGAPGRPPVPWIVSNPIYVGGPWPAVAPSKDRPAVRTSLPIGTGRDAWQIERHPGTLGELDRAPADRPNALVFWFILDKGRPAGQYAALARPWPSEARGYDRIRFRAASDQPMRLSVQLRDEGSPPGRRWGRSVYVDTEERELTVFFDEMTPIGQADSGSLEMTTVRSLLFVVDTTNTLPGTRGIVRVDNVTLEGS
jgi:hypothetical protein